MKFLTPVLLLLVVFLVSSCKRASRQDQIAADLMQTQLPFTKYYKGAAVVANGLGKFHDKVGRWPMGYAELYDSGLLAKSYTYATKEGPAVQGVTKDFATIKVVSISNGKFRYKLTVLGYELEESTMAPDPR